MTGAVGLIPGVAQLQADMAAMSAGVTAFHGQVAGVTTAVSGLTASFSPLRSSIWATITAVKQLAQQLHLLQNPGATFARPAAVNVEAVTGTPKLPRAPKKSDAGIDLAGALTGNLGGGLTKLAAMAGPAGMAAVAVVGAVTAMVTAAAATFGKLKGVVLETVGQFRPFQVELFNRAMRDLQAVFGSFFLPIVQQATGYVRQFANYLFSLPSSFKSFITSAVKVGLVVGGIAAAAVALGGVAAMLAPFATGVGLIVSALGVLIYSFSQTAGGAAFFKKALDTIESVFAGVQGAVLAVWASIAPVRAQLSAAFSGLGTNLSALLDALKPLLALNLAIAGAMVKVALQVIVGALTIFVRHLSLVVSHVTRLAKAVGLNLDRFKLPDVSGRGERSAFGLAAQGANITNDIAGLKTKIEEQIIANTGGATPEEETASNTEQMATEISEMNGHMENMPQRFASLLLGPLGQLLNRQTGGALADVAFGGLAQSLFGK